MNDKEVRAKAQEFLKTLNQVKCSIILMPGGEIRELDSHYLVDSVLMIPKDALDK